MKDGTCSSRDVNEAKGRAGTDFLGGLGQEHPGWFEGSPKASAADASEQKGE